MLNAVRSGSIFFALSLAYFAKKQYLCTRYE